MEYKEIEDDNNLKCKLKLLSEKFNGLYNIRQIALKVNLKFIFNTGTNQIEIIGEGINSPSIIKGYIDSIITVSTIDTTIPFRINITYNRDRSQTLCTGNINFFDIIRTNYIKFNGNLSNGVAVEFIQNPLESNKIRINQILPHNSSSSSIICKGQINGVEAFFKLFYMSGHREVVNNSTNETGLSYEKYIYEYIDGELKKPENNKFQSYFLKLLDTIRTSPTYLYDYINPMLLGNFKERINKLNIKDDSIIGCIVTENNNNIMPLKEFLLSKIVTKADLLNILLVIFNGIRIMNTKLLVFHHDLNYGNILIKEEDTIYYTTIGVIKSKYKILLYDYDMAYNIGKINPILDREFCRNYGNCNKQTKKDYFSILVNLLIFSTDIRYTQNIKEIVHSIIDNDFIYYMDKNILKKNLFPYAYCPLKWYNIILNENRDCSITNLPQLDNVYVRFINKYNTELESLLIPNREAVAEAVAVVDGDKKYFNKYLSYKQKYINLKNNI